MIPLLLVACQGSCTREDKRNGDHLDLHRVRVCEWAFDAMLLLLSTSPLSLDGHDSQTGTLASPRVYMLCAGGAETSLLGLVLFYLQYCTPEIAKPICEIVDQYRIYQWVDDNKPFDDGFGRTDNLSGAGSDPCIYS